jgi:hypothetical protein
MTTGLSPWVAVLTRMKVGCEGGIAMSHAINKPCPRQLLSDWVSLFLSVNVLAGRGWQGLPEVWGPFLLVLRSRDPSLCPGPPAHPFPSLLSHLSEC